MMGAMENVIASHGYTMADICRLIPDFIEELARKCPLSYQKFVEQIDKDLENIISDTESGKQHHFSKGEDEITEHLIAQLKRIYPSVHHDAQQGGHCDIYIEVKGSAGLMYKWIMEAKLWKGFAYVYSGLSEQLLGSYAVGGENSCRGGMIFYSQINSGLKHCMEEWATGLKDKGVLIENKRSDGLRLDTKHHLNTSSGTEFFVKHYGIDLYHAPTEKKENKKKSKTKKVKK